MNGYDSFTCYFCEHELKCPPDGEIRRCKCGAFGVEYTRWETKFLNTHPKEIVDENPALAQQYNFMKSRIKQGLPPFIPFIRHCRVEEDEKKPS